MSSGRIPKKIFKYQLNGKEVKEYVWSNRMILFYNTTNMSQ
jgi:hypothetical protein